MNFGHADQEAAPVLASSGCRIEAACCLDATPIEARLARFAASRQYVRVLIGRLGRLR
jgi:hypothetical protein